MSNNINTNPILNNQSIVYTTNELWVEKFRRLYHQHYNSLYYVNPTIAPKKGDLFKLAFPASPFGPLQVTKQKQNHNQPTNAVFVTTIYSVTSDVDAVDTLNVGDIFLIPEADCDNMTIKQQPPPLYQSINLINLIQKKQPIHRPVLGEVAYDTVFDNQQPFPNNHSIVTTGTFDVVDCNGTSTQITQMWIDGTPQTSQLHNPTYYKPEPVIFLKILTPKGLFGWITVLFSQLEKVDPLKLPTEYENLRST